MRVQKRSQRNRLDHILPQGYLEGFTIPSNGRRLWVFNLERRNWFESSPRIVAAARGFYDYSEGSNPDETADEAFARLETDFPPIRRDLVASNFSSWTKHRDFLVHYSQMLRARSELFRQEVLKEAHNSMYLKVEKVLGSRPDPDRPGQTIFQAKYSEDVDMRGNPRRDAFFKNMSITKMRMEIKKGAGEFAGWRWCLRFTDDASKPIITRDNAVSLIGFDRSSREEAMRYEDTLFVFPICWQACLFGMQQKSDETGPISAEALSQLYRLYLNEPGCRFAYAPHPINHIA